MCSLQFLGESQTQIPLAIMTSDDTHGRTLELLESNSYFGMQPTQVTLLKQVCLLMSVWINSSFCSLHKNCLQLIPIMF